MTLKSDTCLTGQLWQHLRLEFHPPIPVDHVKLAEEVITKLKSGEWHWSDNLEDETGSPVMVGHFVQRLKLEIFLE